MIIRKLFLVESGTFNEQFYRPYEPVIEQASVISTLEEAIGRSREITSFGLAGIAGQIMKPTAVTHGQVQITNGWNNRRFYFMLEVDFPSNFGTTLKEVVTGYTDYVGASKSTHSVDRNMQLHVNGVTTLRQTIEDRGWGPESFWVPVDNSQILFGDFSPSLTTIGMQPASIRPMDIFDTVALSSLPPDAYRLDQRTSFSEGCKKSRRSNNSMPAYLARVLNSASQAFAGAMDYNDQETAMALAADTVKENLIAEDNFMGWLKKRGSYTPTGGFLLSTLFSHDPALESTQDPRMVVMFRSSQGIGSVAHEAGMTESWGGNLMETQFANILAQAIPALMTDCLLTKANIVMGNRNLTGQIMVAPELEANKLPGYASIEDRHPIRGFVDGMDTTPYLQRFFARLVNEVLNDLCMNGQIDFMASARCEMTRDTWIQIQIGANPPITFNYPTFADSLMAPTMSPNQQFLGSLAGKLGVVINTINTNPGHSLPKQPTIMTYGGGTPGQVGGGVFNPHNGDDYGSSGAL